MTRALVLALAVLLLAPAGVAVAATPAQPVAPAPGFRVVVDAGHGGRDPGAISSVAPLKEKDVTLKVALLTGAALQRRGIGVVYTRTDDRYVELSERAAIADHSGASLLVSLHLNSAPDPSVNGAEAWYGAGPRDADVAGAMLSGLGPVLRDYGLNIRGTRHGPGLAVLRAAAPAALIELGYLSNPREAVLLTRTAFLERLAEGVAAGVVRYRDGLSGGAPRAPAVQAPRSAPLLPLTDLYFVRRGDTLGTIANRFRTAAEELARLNPVLDAARLLPGSPVHVPTGEAMVASWATSQQPAAAPVGQRTVAASAPGAEWHTVRPGETLSEIALRYGIATGDLAARNGIADAGRILPGQRLRVGPGGATPARAVAPGAAPSGGATAGGGQSAGGVARRYRVQVGDTLSEIALRFGVSQAALLAANPLSDPNHVLVGTTLTIPTRS